MTESAPFRLDLEPVNEAELPLTFLLSVSAQGRTVWPVHNAPEHPIEIQLDDLFAYLVEFWKPLLLRQTYPLNLTPSRPSQLAMMASKRWEDKAQVQIEEEAADVEAFEEAHDLSRAFGGLFDLPSLWLLRQGEQMICDSGRSMDRVPFNAVSIELTRVGDWIADRLHALDAAKWDRVCAAWYERDHGSQSNLVSWSASLEPAVAERLIGAGLIEPPANFQEAANDNDELLIAARMAGALPADQIAEILTIARSFAHHEAVTLDKLSQDALAHMGQLAATKPFNEGEALADFMRDWLGISPAERFDVFGVAALLDIEVVAKEVGPATFDGLAIAGAHYGPGAFINVGADRIRDKSALSDDAGARVNLAHELCHLLVDRSHPLSAVDVLNSRMPAAVEARARAFAAQLLLPSATAAKIWDEAGCPVDRPGLEAVLQNLADTYGVSFSVAAWKLEHGARWGLAAGGHAHWRLVRDLLDELAPFR